MDPIVKGTRRRLAGTDGGGIESGSRDGGGRDAGGRDDIRGGRDCKRSGGDGAHSCAHSYDTLGRDGGAAMAAVDGETMPPT